MEAPAGPNPEDMAAAAQMGEEDRDAMIRSMVDGLAARLADEPGDLEGWLRLGRSYAVLGELAMASDAYSRAAALAPDDVGVLLDYANVLMDQAGAEVPPPDDAVAIYGRTLELDPANPDALWILAMSRAESGDIVGSLGLLEQLLAILPPDGESHAMVEGLINELAP